MIEQMICHVTGSLLSFRRFQGRTVSPLQSRAPIGVVNSGLDLAGLETAVHHLCTASIAPATQRTYRTAVQRYSTFCSAYSTPLFPLSESTLCYFATVLSYQGLALQSIKTYLSAVKHMHVLHGHAPLPAMPRLQMVLNGAQRLQPVLRNQAPRNRLPITPTILGQLHGIWVSHQDRAYGAMIWAAASTCFFGFFRSGEITIPSVSSYDPQSHLSWGDVAVDDPVFPSCVRVHLRRSKCDPIGRGVDVYFGPVNERLCPVWALLSYAAGRGDRPGPFFIHPDATPLTKTHFVGAVRLALRQAGLEPRDYAGHIGAAEKHSMALPCSPLLSYLFSITSYTPHHAHAPVALFFISLQKDRSRMKNPNDDYMGHNPIVRST